MIMMRLTKYPGAVNHLKISDSAELYNKVLHFLFKFPPTFYEHLVKCLQWQRINQYSYLCICRGLK